MSDPPSQNFNAIRGMIHATHPCFAKYRDDTTARKLCPHVLGYIDEGTETQDTERVLCYQLTGPEPNPGWRCFDLIHLTLVNPPPPPNDWVTPPDYSDWQNSVKGVKHYVPFPP